LAKILTEDQMNVYFGRSKTNHIPTRYVLLSGRHADDTLTKHCEVARRVTGRVCPRCGFLNPGEGLYCSMCSAVLSEAEAFRM